MDALDYKALSRLQQFGRDNWKKLGELLGITAQAAADRIRRLEGDGVIQGYAALVDPNALGLHLTAFVAVSIERPRYLEDFLSRVVSLSEVQECHHVSGDRDYLLKIRCRGPTELERVLSDQIAGLTGVAGLRTTLVLRTVKETVALPLITGPVGE
jgi:Lrp/AsnC family transcriptional regulator, leucine-responsive regulatory protein